MQVLVVWFRKVIILSSQKLTRKACCTTAFFLKRGLLFEHAVFKVIVALLDTLFQSTKIFVVAIHVFFFSPFCFELLFC